MRSKSLVLACVAGLGVGLLAGCGSSAPLSRDPVASSLSSPSPAATPPSPGESAMLPLEIVLKRADLPASWTSKPYNFGATPTKAAEQAELAKCVGTRNADPEKVGDAHSNNYYSPDGSIMISSSAASYKSQSDLDADLAMWRSPKFSPCLEEQAKKQLTPLLPSGGKLDSVSYQITLGSAAGPDNIVATGTGTIKISGNDKLIVKNVRLAFISGSFIKAEVVAASYDTPLPESQVTSLFAAVANRAARG